MANPPNARPHGWSKRIFCSCQLCHHRYANRQEGKPEPAVHTGSWVDWVRSHYTAEERQLADQAGQALLAP